MTLAELTVTEQCYRAGLLVLAASSVSPHRERSGFGEAGWPRPDIEVVDLDSHPDGGARRDCGKSRRLLVTVPDADSVGRRWRGA